MATSPTRKAHSILCVDDEIDNVEALERLFRRKYNVLKATSAAEATDLLKKNDVTVIISDQRMPRKTGVEFLKESIQIAPNAIRILLTGYTDIESVIEAINSGEIYRYITKPWDPHDLANTVDKAVEKYELSAKLKEKNLELQHANKQLELANEQLEERNAELNLAYQEIKTLDDAKNKFMILINHELKTPLTVIMSFLELLKETTLNIEQQKYIDRISTSANKLKRLIDDSLAFVSAETGLTKISKQKVSSKELLNALVEKYQEQAAAKNLQFKVSRDDTKLKADPQILVNVLDRLIENAIKFANENSEIALEAHDLDEKSVQLSVTNSGQPLTEQMLAKINQPFNLDEDVMNHSKGLGLSLSLSQALLKQHSSQLKFDCPSGSVKASFCIEKLND
jgi:two-component system sensor histidine kinase/response regulator